MRRPADGGNNRDRGYKQMRDRDYKLKRGSTGLKLWLSLTGFWNGSVYKNVQTEKKSEGKQTLNLNANSLHNIPHSRT